MGPHLSVSSFPRRGPRIRAPSPPGAMHRAALCLAATVPRARALKAIDSVGPSLKPRRRPVRSCAAARCLSASRQCAHGLRPDRRRSPDRLCAGSATPCPTTTVRTPPLALAGELPLLLPCPPLTTSAHPSSLPCTASRRPL
jgi:hypothetical protein